MVKYMKENKDGPSPKSNDGSFLSYGSLVDEERVPRMCGRGMLDKILRKPNKPSHRQQLSPIRSVVRAKPGAARNVTRARMDPPYSQVPGSFRSPTSDSGSVVGRNDENSLADADADADADTVAVAVPPSPDKRIAQFDPQHVLTVNDDQQSIEVTPTPSIKQPDRKFFATPKYQSPETPGNAGGTHSTRSTVSSISGRLSSVVEEEVNEGGAVDTEEGTGRGVSPKDVQQKDSSTITTRTTITRENARENSDVLAAMRALVMRQQAALKKLSERNQNFRVELEKKQSSLQELEEVKGKHEEEINKLVTQKMVAEAEATYLREEVKAMENELNELTRKATMIHERKSKKNKHDQRHGGQARKQDIFRFDSVSSDEDSRGSSSDEEGGDEEISNFKKTYNALRTSWENASRGRISPGVSSSESSYGDQEAADAAFDDMSDAKYSRRPLVNKANDEIAESRSDVIYSSRPKGERRDGRGSSLERDALVADRRDAASSPFDRDLPLADKREETPSSSFGQEDRKRPGKSVSFDGRTDPGADAKSDTSEQLSDDSDRSDPRSVSTAQISLGKAPSGPKATKEDLAIFRERLEVIQKRRMDRRSEKLKRTGSNRSVVRFE